MLVNGQRRTAVSFKGLWFVLILIFIMAGCRGKSNSPVSVEISPFTATLDATRTQQFTATVKNASNKRVTWKVTGPSGHDCGTVSPAGLYTAPSVIPASIGVTITAVSQADPSKSGTARLNLLPLTLTIPKDPVALGAGETHQFTANVARNPNTKVTWSLAECTGADCGAIAASGLYTAPSSIPSSATVTVTATSQADPTKSDSVTLHQLPVAVSIGPTRRLVGMGATLNFTATVQHDRENAGVTWSLGGCPASDCGALTNVTRTSVTYTAPAAVPDPSSVLLSAKSLTDASKTAAASITISASTLLKEGDYAFQFTGGDTAITGRFHADSFGNITDGIEDVNTKSGVFQSVAFTGTYVVNTDFRGSFTITTKDETSTFSMTVDPSGTKGQFIKFDGLPANTPVSGAGFFEIQDKAAFSLSALAGPYVIKIFSEDRPFAGVGGLVAGTTGEFSNGRMDLTEHVISNNYYTPDSSSKPFNLAGSISAPSSGTGRGIANMILTPTPRGGAGTFNFAYYVISDQKILLVQTDAHTSNSPVLSGEMRRQDGLFSVASFNAPSIFNINGFGLFGLAAAAGRMVPDGSGGMTGMIDQNDIADSWDDSGILNEAFHGSYSVESDGRSLMTLQSNFDQWTYTAYFFSQNQAFLLQTSNFFPALGRMQPQAGGPFTAASISETFLTNTMPGQIGTAENLSGLTTFDAVSMVTSTWDITYYSDLTQHDLSGRYTVDANGRGTITFDSPTKRTMVFWAISPTELVALPTDTGVPLLIECRK